MDVPGNRMHTHTNIPSFLTMVVVLKTHRALIYIQAHCSKDMTLRKGIGGKNSFCLVDSPTNTTVVTSPSFWLSSVCKSVPRTPHTPIFYRVKNYPQPPAFHCQHRNRKLSGSPRHLCGNDFLGARASRHTKASVIPIRHHLPVKSVKWCLLGGWQIPIPVSENNSTTPLGEETLFSEEKKSPVLFCMLPISFEI